MTTTYSITAISFIVLQFVSVILVTLLICNILKSEPYFTKWTLFQVCIPALASGLTSLPLIIMYGDELASRAFETPLCVILQKISLYFTYPLEFFSCALAFYLWYALIRRDLNIENKCFKYVSWSIWIYTTIYNGILFITSGKEENWGVIPSNLSCKNSKNVWSIYGYIVSTSILVFIAILLTFHSIIILWKRKLTFENVQNRRTAIRLGEAVRLCTWCISIVILATLPLIPRAIQSDSPGNNNNIDISQISNFTSSLEGTLLFLIFGTDRKAALFLPCYYSPPEKSRMPQYSFPDESIDTSNLNDELSQISNAHLKQDTFNHLTSYDDLGSGSSHDDRQHTL